MAVFPQLSTGASVQYPVHKTLTRPALRRDFGGGGSRYYMNAERGERWEFILEGLVKSEIEEILALHGSVAGRLRTFLFLDPTANLLLHSEALDNGIWQKDPMVVLTGGSIDPDGGTNAFNITNTGSNHAKVFQELPVPGVYQYCLSAFIRGSAGGVRLTATCGTETVERDAGTTTSWKRVWMPVTFQAGLDVQFGVTLAPGAGCEVFGFQVDGQPNPGPYRRSSVTGGVIQRARFVDDDLSVQATGRDEYTVRVGVMRAG